MVMPEAGRVLSKCQANGNIFDAIGGKYLNMWYIQFKKKMLQEMLIIRGRKSPEAFPGASVWIPDTKFINI